MTRIVRITSKLAHHISEIGETGVERAVVELDGAESGRGGRIPAVSASAAVATSAVQGGFNPVVNVAGRGPLEGRHWSTDGEVLLGHCIVPMDTEK